MNKLFFGLCGAAVLGVVWFAMPKHGSGSAMSGDGMSFGSGPNGSGAGSPSGSGGKGLVEAPAALPAPDGVASAPSRMLLVRGVQEFCLDQYELDSCLAYAVKCGKDCTSLLPESLVARMHKDYNKYLAAKGDNKPLKPLRGSSARIPAAKAPAVKLPAVKSTLKSGSI